MFPKTQVWAKTLPDDTHAVLLINLDTDNNEVAVTLEELGLQGSYVATNVWNGETSQMSNQITAKLDAHASHFYFLKPAKITA